jgi:hypothetical protein
MRLSQAERADIIARLERIEEERLRILDVLLPPDEDDIARPDGCTHPTDALEDRSTFDEERYHCTTCGADFSQHPRTLNPEE